MEKELVKKYISLLKLIIEREIVYPEKEDSDPESPEGAWDISNSFFHLKISEFKRLFSTLENIGILKVVSFLAIPQFIGEEMVYDENGKSIDSDEVVFEYKKVDLKKAKKYRKELEAILTPEEISNIKNVSKISSEPKLKEAGSLNLRHSGVICYENNIIDMRTGLKTLCELFIERPNQLINRNDIEDELGVDSEKLKSTIAKYVSELNKILEPYFKRQPIINHKKEGWIFQP